MMFQKSVVLLSGGLDSTVTTYQARTESKNVFGITFLYGQRHSRETQSAKDIGKAARLSDHIMFILDLSQFGGSSLLSQAQNQIPTDTSLEDIGKTIPTTYVPARNTIFLSIALAYAETVEADAIYIGVTAADYSGYPDCRPEFIEAFQHLVSVATKQTVQKKQILIQTPLLYLSKSDIIKKGVKLGVPFEKTWSCYQGKKNACGSCESCMLRLRGFQQAGVSDPLAYESLPTWYTSD